jgi:crossover junction endodeoxyribonuclease RuvC
MIAPVCVAAHGFASRRPVAGPESKTVIIIGIDPGLANTGYGVVARRGERLLEILDEHHCEAMALEQLYFGQNVRTAFAVGHARGVAMLAAGQRGIPCFSYTPQRVKAAVCGNGRASKDQVARMVGALLCLPAIPTPDHASDALAVAVCHCNGAPLTQALAASVSQS